MESWDGRIIANLVISTFGELLIWNICSRPDLISQLNSLHLTESSSELWCRPGLLETGVTSRWTVVQCTDRVNAGELSIGPTHTFGCFLPVWSTPIQCSVKVDHLSNFKQLLTLTKIPLDSAKKKILMWLLLWAELKKSRSKQTTFLSKLKQEGFSRVTWASVKRWLWAPIQTNVLFTKPSILSGLNFPEKHTHYNKRKYKFCNLQKTINTVASEIWKFFITNDQESQQLFGLIWCFISILLVLYSYE